MGPFGFVNDSWLPWQWSLYKQTQYGGLIDMGTCIGIVLYNHLDNKCYLLISWIMNFIQGGVSTKFTWVEITIKITCQVQEFYYREPIWNLE
jgi:hypothetical protein